MKPGAATQEIIWIIYMYTSMWFQGPENILAKLAENWLNLLFILTVVLSFMCILIIHSQIFQVVHVLNLLIYINWYIPSIIYPTVKQTLK